MLNIIRNFPLLHNKESRQNFVFLDNAATTQKPQVVLDAIINYYSCENANVHRGLHHLSQIASEHYETSRKTISYFLNAADAYTTVFTRNTTESINLAASCLGRSHLHPGDEVLLTRMEHHSNLIPWQTVCRDTGAVIRIIPINDSGELNMNAFYDQLNNRTKIVAITHVSNVLGTINPVKEICAKAREQGAISLVDGAQSIAHRHIDLQDMGADFFAFSGHKMYGPTGIGVLVGRTEIMEGLPPYQTGSGMVLNVSADDATFRELPYRFEAGTPHIAGVIGLAAAVDYLIGIGMDTVTKHEQELLGYLTGELKKVKGLRIIGESANKTGVLSFTMDCAHPHDIAQILDNEGVAIRSGHHCAQPLMQFYNVPATARISLGIYNTKHDVDVLLNAIQQVRKVFA